MDAETIARALRSIVPHEDATAILSAKASDLTASICMPFEGFYPKPYLCPADVWTIGFGTTRYPDGTPVHPKDPPITREWAEHLMQHEIKRVCLPAVKRQCPQLEKPQHIAAIADFVYNLGAGRLQASTLRKRINAGRFEDVPTELRKWVMGGGKKLNGLVKRREAEIIMWGSA